MATYEGHGVYQGAKAPCLDGVPGSGGGRDGLKHAPERPRVWLEYRPNRFFASGNNFCAPPLEVFVMVPFDVTNRGGEGVTLGEASAVKFLRPDVVARRETPCLDKRPRAVSFYYPDTLGELFGGSGCYNEVYMVGEYVPGQEGDAMLAANLDDTSGYNPLVVRAKYYRLAGFNVECHHSGGDAGVVRYERYQPPLHNSNPVRVVRQGALAP
jgi:hypothetical protein